MEASFIPGESLSFYQKLMKDIYGMPNDRNFALPDILAQQQRFTMRALKCIRKKDIERLKLNLLDAFSWSFTVANRMHFDIETIVWQRFPYLCSYCGTQPCSCKETKPTSRPTLTIDESRRPKSLKEVQAMFEHIYPSSERTLDIAAVHWAEEMGEVSEAIHAYLSEHRPEQVQLIAEEIADFISCIFGVANSSGIDVDQESSKLFSNGCFACHEAPCVCSVAYINTFQS